MPKGQQKSNKEAKKPKKAPPPKSPAGGTPTQSPSQKSKDYD